MSLPTNCPNCGAPLKGRYRCEYCGTELSTRPSPEKVYVIERYSRVHVLEAQMAIPFEAKAYMDEDALSKYTIRELTRQLAEGLASAMKVDVYDDPCQMRTVIRGTVRVLPPDFRF